MISNVIKVIKDDLIQTFDDVFDWFNVHDPLLHYSPVNKGWNIKEVLEHISLTNHYLLILIRKGTRKAIQKSGKTDYAGLLQGYNLDIDKMRKIGLHGSFEWNRPAHMEPKGRMAMPDIQGKLQLQLDECLGYLDSLQHGEGVLYKTMMSVNGLGKIDVYHYIYFLAQHARRHLVQLEGIEHEYNLGV